MREVYDAVHQMSWRLTVDEAHDINGYTNFGIRRLSVQIASKGTLTAEFQLAKPPPDEAIGEYHDLLMTTPPEGALAAAVEKSGLYTKK